jgi:hypothetical protein
MLRDSRNIWEQGSHDRASYGNDLMGIEAGEGGNAA